MQLIPIAFLLAMGPYAELLNVRLDRKMGGWTAREEDFEAPQRIGIWAYVSRLRISGQRDRRFRHRDHVIRTS